MYGKNNISSNPKGLQVKAATYFDRKRPLGDFRKTFLPLWNNSVEFSGAPLLPPYSSLFSLPLLPRTRNGSRKAKCTVSHAYCEKNSWNHLEKSTFFSSSLDFNCHRPTVVNLVLFISSTIVITIKNILWTSDLRHCTVI